MGKSRRYIWRLVFCQVRENMTNASTIRVYHFCNQEFGLQNLEKSRLKVATVMDLNDPFEMMCYSSSEEGMRRAISYFKSRVAELYGMLCFSKTFVSPVQWGHYGDRHKGLCLAFDVSAEDLHTVEYRKGRMQFDPEGFIKRSKDERFNIMLRQLRIKHSEWSYEKEVRQIFLLSKAEKNGELYFKPFSEIGKLRQVILGCNSSVSREQLKRSLGDRYGEVECFKVRTAFKNYKIVRNLDDSLWK
ncbi:hypothetical protein CT157_13300 [Pseudomonas syringae]|uniref:DUF2971 domain-containing protein n=1 Tax=Pseudomonas syringae TaxID=317 RepID=A0A3T0JTY5_PSESX|nr:hypothetical protein CT157_13300 [Pseudomonas syringae]